MVLPLAKALLATLLAMSGHRAGAVRLGRATGYCRWVTTRRLTPRE